MSAVETCKPQTPAKRRRGSASAVSDTLAMIATAARDPSVNVDKMERLLQMRDRAVAQEAEKQFNIAMSRLQSILPRVYRSSKSDKGKYADLEAIDIATRDPITAHGFAESYGTAESHIPEHYRVTCLLSHVEGFSRPYQADMPISMKGPKGNDVMTPVHAFGSAMSYGRRYLKCLIFNIVLTNEDDNGKKTSQADAFTVSNDQIEEIRQLLTATKSNEAKFLEVMKVSAIENILESKFDYVMTVISDTAQRRLAREAAK